MDAKKVSTRGTTTHRVDSSSKEVVIITVPADSVGKNSDGPPNPYDFSFSHEMRATYFHDDGQIGVQFPRWSDEFTSISERGELTDVLLGTDNTISGIYALRENHVILVTWDTPHDNWEFESRKVPPGKIISSSNGVIWSAHRGRPLVGERTF